MTTHAPIVIDLDEKPYRSILFEGLLRQYETMTEEQSFKDGKPEAPALWRIIGAPDRKEIMAKWQEHVRRASLLCAGMEELADPECDTFTWLFGNAELIETVRQARGGITEWVGEAPLDRWSELADVLTTADAMLAEYDKFDPATEGQPDPPMAPEDETWTPPEDEPEPTVTVERETIVKGNGAVKLPQEDIAAITRTLDSHMIGEFAFGSSDSYELTRMLGIEDGTHEPDGAKFRQVGDKLALIGRVFETMANREYPFDDEAQALLAVLLKEAEYDAETADNEQDKAINTGRAEIMKLVVETVTRVGSEATAKAQPEPERYLSVEYQAAVLRTLESYMLGLNLDENMEANLGIDEKLNADALDSYGGRFSLYARVLRALERRQYPEDEQALALLGELVDDAAHDVQTAMDATDSLLCSARREFVSILYTGIRGKLGLPKDGAREGRA
ncbi:MAG TPA: hypothetical protein VK730_13750 [Solirubrobacteraceae bacterium]|jgi:hypothetical protein|nr:hypothetical protein [Solirubrobacteraceae bacterium]